MHPKLETQKPKPETPTPKCETQGLEYICDNLLTKKKNEALSYPGFLNIELFDVKVELVSGDLTRILSKKLPNFHSFSRLLYQEFF